MKRKMEAPRSSGCSNKMIPSLTYSLSLSFLMLLASSTLVEPVVAPTTTRVFQTCFSSKLWNHHQAESMSAPAFRMQRLEMSPSPGGNSRLLRSIVAAETERVPALHFSSRQVASRKAQLRRISQTVQKIQAREKFVSGVGNATLEEDAVDSSSTTAACNAQVVHALSLLSTARTQQQVVEAGRLLEKANLCRTQPKAVQERVVKAAAMTGLLQLALTITEHMLQQPQPDRDTGNTNVPYFPSEICQDAICTALRQAGRIQRLELLLCQFGTALQTDNSNPRRRISTVSFNTYLAALCDVALRKDVATTQQQQQRGMDRVLGFDTPLSKGTTVQVSNDNGKSIESLDRAWHWIRDPTHTASAMAVTPDVVSYATVIQAAAAVGNHTLVESIWHEIKRRNVSPNIVAYNARLRCIGDGESDDNAITAAPDGTNLSLDVVRLKHKKRDQRNLLIWDDEISTDSLVRPDKYTIDFLLLPLIRAGRIGDVEALLDGFVKRNSEKVVSNAFTAFLITVVNGGELATARALFEMYILPTLLAPVIVGVAGGMIRIVRPTTRHFNVLLEGYRKALQRDQFVNGSEVNHLSLVAQEAWTLYQLMIQAWGVQPDAFTITSMMGLCRTSEELSNLLVEAIADLGMECSSVFLRAALTAYGDLNDAASALWLFSKFPSKSTRTWNVLLGSLAKVAESNALGVFNPISSVAARTFQTRTKEIRFIAPREIKELQRVSTLADVVMYALNAMCESNVAARTSGFTIAPAADSQTFCVAAAALQYVPTTGAILGTELFRNATTYGVQSDGRFVNAMLRCFGTDIDAALALWRDEVRPHFGTIEKIMPGRASGKNLVASYSGLLYVCGRANRPDIALRLVYAMKRDKFEPSEASLNAYRSGQRRRATLISIEETSNDGGFGSVLERKVYESLLFVECTKYDRNDRRRVGEKRVRIIL